MTTPDFTMKEDDLLPVCEAILRDRDGVVDLTTATGVAFHARQIGGAKVVSGTGTIVTPAAGLVRYSWVAGDTDTPGQYRIEWEVTFPGPKAMTFPNATDDLLTIRPQVA